jgi:hypothetical protein
MLMSNLWQESIYIQIKIQSRDYKYNKKNIYIFFGNFWIRTWWRLFQKRVVRTKFDIYILILIIPSFSGARLVQWVRSWDLTAHTSLSPIRHGFAPNFVNYCIFSILCNVFRLLFVRLSFLFCVVCPSSIYSFWLLLWCLQTVFLKSCIRLIWFDFWCFNATFSNISAISCRKRAHSTRSRKW